MRHDSFGESRESDWTGRILGNLRQGPGLDENLAEPGQLPIVEGGGDYQHKQ
jgi:hypothetical protein